jgi:AcrR family transcriptional regulator
LTRPQFNVTVMDMKSPRAEKRTRGYRMVTRAETARETEQRIIDAAFAEFSTRYYDEVTLQEIADRAGVALKTVLRKFASKEGVLTAMAERTVGRVVDPRYQAAPGDVDAAVAAMLGSYEFIGDASIRMLAQEDRVPALRTLTNRGRAEHRRWVERTFAEWLRAHKGAARRRRLALLITATDVYCWKLWHRDLGFNRRETGLLMKELLLAIAKLP